MLELILGARQPPAAAGQAIFTAIGDTVWVVPPGVSLVSAVVVGRGYRGGGGLSWRNNIPVTPGESLIIKHNTTSGGIYRAANPLVLATCGPISSAEGGQGGVSVLSLNDGGGNGGKGGVHSNNPWMGGGAGGYRGNGGNSLQTISGDGSGSPGQGGGGGGGGYGGTIGNGGGVGLQGQGTNGAAGIPNPGNPNAGAGSIADGQTRTIVYGGGSWWAASYIKDTDYNGATRIMWGASRSYPDNALDV